MVKYSGIMNLREEEIAKLIEYLSKQTDRFENPKIVMIGGYAPQSTLVSNPQPLL